MVPFVSSVLGSWDNTPISSLLNNYISHNGFQSWIEHLIRGWVFQGWLRFDTNVNDFLIDYLGINAALFEWADSYDSKDWKRLSKCIAPELRVSLSSSIRSQPDQPHPLTSHHID